MNDLENVLDEFEMEQVFQAKRFYLYGWIINGCVAFIGLAPCAIALIVNTCEPGDPMIGSFFTAEYLVFALMLFSVLALPTHIVLHYLNINRAIAFCRAYDHPFVKKLGRLRLGYSFVLAILIMLTVYVAWILFYPFDSIDDLRFYIGLLVGDMAKTRAEFFTIAGPMVGGGFLICAGIIIWTNRAIKLELKPKTFLLT